MGPHRPALDPGVIEGRPESTAEIRGVSPSCARVSPVESPEDHLGGGGTAQGPVIVLGGGGIVVRSVDVRQDERMRLGIAFVDGVCLPLAVGQLLVPPDAVLHKPGDSRNHYSHAYVDWVGRNFSLCEVRTGWNNQTSPLLFRLWDLFSTWGRDNGLQSVIPATLALSLTGYPFTFPDMIGGNGYFMFPKNKLLRALINKVIIPLMERNKQNNSGDEYAGVHASDVPEFIQTKAMFGWPTAELMIRWTQLNALLPVMQFSITPWQFGEECTDICRKYTELHLEFTSLFELLAERSTRTGEPIVRPVFWLAPDDEKALLCDDQFLVGDEILVAPFTDPGWTPLFVNAAGLVLEVGGLMTHGSVVAREYGLPAVVGIPHITDHLRDGDVVLLDGLTGTVTLEGRR